MRQPKTNFGTAPFINGYTSTDQSVKFLIGESRAQDELFESTLPQIVEVLCELRPKRDFPEVEVWANYPTPEGMKTMRFRPYNDLPRSYVSGFDLKVIFIENEFIMSQLKNEVIYQKDFLLETPRKIVNRPDPKGLHNFQTLTDPQPLCGKIAQDLRQIEPITYRLGTSASCEPFIRMAPFHEDPLDQGGRSLLDEVQDNSIKFTTNNEEYHSVGTVGDLSYENKVKIIFSKTLDTPQGLVI
jgi:hypothetical protein